MTLHPSTTLFCYNSILHEEVWSNRRLSSPQNCLHDSPSLSTACGPKHFQYKYSSLAGQLYLLTTSNRYPSFKISCDSPNPSDAASGIRSCFLNYVEGPNPSDAPLDRISCLNGFGPNRMLAGIISSLLMKCSYYGSTEVDSVTTIRVIDHMCQTIILRHSLTSIVVLSHFITCRQCTFLSSFSPLVASTY